MYTKSLKVIIPELRNDGIILMNISICIYKKNYDNPMIKCYFLKWGDKRIKKKISVSNKRKLLA